MQTKQIFESKHSMVINRPVEEVFAFVTDLEQHPRWMIGAHKSEKLSKGPLGKGKKLRTTGRFLGKDYEATREITEYEENRTFAVNLTSKLGTAVARLTLEPVEGGTKLTVEKQSHVQAGALGRFFGMAEPLFLKIVERRAEAMFGTLKDLIEAGPPHSKSTPTT